MITKQNLFTEEELAKVTDEAERKHLIECAQDQSKIDMKYMEIMSKYDLWEKGNQRTGKAIIGAIWILGE